MPKIYDSWDKIYKSKFGALKQGEPCIFMVRIPKSVFHDLPPIMVIFRPGFKERYLMMNETASTDEYTEYSAEYSPTFCGVHYYYFTLVMGGTRGYIKRKGPSEGILGEGDLFQLTVFADSYKTPDFIKGGIIYQIFPDRFCKGEYDQKEFPEGRVMRDDWGGVPYYRPDEKGHVWNNDYFGGNLQGIIDKLPYLNSLGVTCLYLNPIFEAHENHRYNTANYRKIDPLLGTNEDFRRLCAEAKKYSIGVILDGVFSHTGADSIYFNKYNRYDSVGAYNSQKSPYYPWYTFINYPDTYEAWWGIDTLPNVNENNRQYTDYICSEGGVLDYWFYMGASGFRLDVADELPDEFLDNLRIAVKRNGSEKLLIGEVWEDASNKESYGIKRRYLTGKQLDSTMNYPFRDAVLGYAMGMSGTEFRNRIIGIIENYPKPSIDALMNFVSTHDVERAINILGGESCGGKSKDWQAETKLTPDRYRLGKNRLKIAMVLQFFLPGVPSIYYGDEAGMQGYKDPFNRGCYPWGSEDVELISFVRSLAKIRRRCDLFREAGIKFLFWEGDVLGFARIDKEKCRAAVIIVNRGEKVEYVQAKSDYFSAFNEYEVVRGNVDGHNIVLNPYDYAVVKIGKDIPTSEFDMQKKD